MLLQTGIYVFKSKNVSFPLTNSSKRITHSFIHEARRPWDIKTLLYDLPCLREICIYKIQNMKLHACLGKFIYYLFKRKLSKSLPKNTSPIPYFLPSSKVKLFNIAIIMYNKCMIYYRLIASMWHMYVWLERHITMCWM